MMSVGSASVNAPLRNAPRWSVGYLASRGLYSETYGIGFASSEAGPPRYRARPWRWRKRDRPYFPRRGVVCKGRITGCWVWRPRRFVPSSFTVVPLHSGREEPWPTTGSAALFRCAAEHSSRYGDTRPGRHWPSDGDWYRPRRRRLLVVRARVGAAGVRLPTVAPGAARRVNARRGSCPGCRDL